MSALPRIGLAVACILAVGLAVTRWGGSADTRPRLSKAEYDQHLQLVTERLNSSLSTVFGVAGAQASDDLDQIAAQVDAMQAAVAQAADDLDSVRPPDDIDGAHQKLVSGGRQLADKIGDLADAFRDADPFAVVGIMRSSGLRHALENLGEAVHELQAQGYSPNPIGSLGLG